MNMWSFQEKKSPLVFFRILGTIFFFARTRGTSWQKGGICKIYITDKYSFHLFYNKKGVDVDVVLSFSPVTLINSSSHVWKYHVLHRQFICAEKVPRGADLSLYPRFGISQDLLFRALFKHREQQTNFCLKQLVATESFVSLFSDGYIQGVGSAKTSSVESSVSMAFISAQRDRRFSVMPSSERDAVILVSVTSDFSLPSLYGIYIDHDRRHLSWKDGKRLVSLWPVESLRSFDVYNKKIQQVLFKKGKTRSVESFAIFGDKILSVKGIVPVIEPGSFNLADLLHSGSISFMEKWFLSSKQSTVLLESGDLSDADNDLLVLLTMYGVLRCKEYVPPSLREKCFSVYKKYQKVEEVLSAHEMLYMVFIANLEGEEGSVKRYKSRLRSITKLNNRNQSVPYLLSYALYLFQDGDILFAQELCDRVITLFKKYETSKISYELAQFADMIPLLSLFIASNRGPASYQEVYDCYIRILCDSRNKDGSFYGRRYDNTPYTRGTLKILESLVRSKYKDALSFVENARVFLWNMQYRDENMLFIKKDLREKFSGGMRHDYLNGCVWVDSMGHYFLLKSFEGEIYT